MRIAVSTWSVHREMEKGMSLEKFMDHCASWGVAEIEIVEVHLPGTDDYTLDQIREEAYARGLSVVCLALNNDLTLERDQLNAQAAHLAEGMGWAARLGAGVVRVNTGRTREDQPVISQVIRALCSLSTMALVLGVAMALENHGGISSDPDNLVRIVSEVNSPMLGICPDFGNFPAATRYPALAKVAPLALHVHAKSYDFGPDGEETTIDYGRCLSLLKDAGYDKVLSVEFEGPGDELEGTRHTIELIRRYLD